jgi:hypothetical protein
MTWFYSASNTKSIMELNSLVKDVILAPDFQRDDLVGFNAKKEQAVMDSYRSDMSLEEATPFASMILGSKARLRFHYHATVSSNPRRTHQNFQSRSTTENSWMLSKLLCLSLPLKNSTSSHLKNSGSRTQTNLKNEYQKAIPATAGMKNTQGSMKRIRKDSTQPSRPFLWPL